MKNGMFISPVNGGFGGREKSFDPESLSRMPDPEVGNRAGRSFFREKATRYAQTSFSLHKDLPTRFPSGLGVASVVY